MSVQNKQPKGRKHIKLRAIDLRQNGPAICMQLYKIIAIAGVYICKSLLLGSDDEACTSTYARCDLFRLYTVLKYLGLVHEATVIWAPKCHMLLFLCASAFLICVWIADKTIHPTFGVSK